MPTLFERRDVLASALAQAAGIAVVLDHSTPRTLRVAVPDWDGLPKFCTAIGWTSSQPLLLLEVATDGGRTVLRIHFVLGPGPTMVSTRYHQALVAAMPELRRRQEITGTRTRLGSAILAKGMKAQDLDSDAVPTTLQSGCRIMPVSRCVLRLISRRRRGVRMMAFDSAGRLRRQQDPEPCGASAD